MAVVIDHHHGFKPFTRTKRCKLRSFTHLDFARLELDWTNATPTTCFFNTPSQTTTSFHRSFSTPCLSNAARPPMQTPRIEILAGHRAPGVRALVVEASIAMASGIDPVPASSGLGGAYYLLNPRGESIAVVKPMTEDPTSSLNNPTIGNVGRSVRAGETGVREVAAYLLDHNSFVGVLPTALIRLSHFNGSSKTASIQRFIPHDFDAGELGPSGFSVASVHRIGILDVRLLNIDRHAGNILVKKMNPCSYVGAAELVPIDHGLCLPESINDPYFEWLHWPQASVPFSESETEYINKLDPFKDAELLRTELPLLRESSIRILLLCTIFLKRAASAGLCLADIGDMMTREFRGTEEEPSVLENLCIQANDSFDGLLDFDTEGEDKEEEANEGFQFDMECNERDHVVDVIDLPQLLQGRPKVPLKIPSARSMAECPHAVLSPLHEGENDDDDDDEGSGEEEDGGGEEKDGGGGKGAELKVRYLPKSVSFSVMEHNHECNDISFKDMGEEEWGLFLERFEELLPEVFESRKNMRLKQRMGTSCKF
ncbi:hypothetical protein MRB53_008070 [Persea americana]|uniref:Uncharacterized protein n=1 Tax=Persea americana TaxID=3435 RepID=A0ACC2MME7_PERAE|nr:hypothetical protein MRB53_008070 [Persea americana]